MAKARERERLGQLQRQRFDGRVRGAERNISSVTLNPAAQQWRIGESEIHIFE